MTSHRASGGKGVEGKDRVEGRRAGAGSVSSYLGVEEQRTASLSI